jgi:hypothetical protein
MVLIPTVNYEKERLETVLVHFYCKYHRTTSAQVNHDNKIAAVRWHNPELAMITLVRSRSHKIGVTRSHELPEATLDHHLPKM